MTGRFGGKRTHVNLHFPVQPVVEEEVVRHADPVGLHGMALAVVVVPNVPWDTRKDPDVFTAKYVQKRRSYHAFSITRLTQLN